MKKTLLSIISLISLSGFAQTVNNFYVFDGANSAGVPYVIAQTSPDQTVSGENAVWDFSNLTSAGTSTTTTMDPTASQLTTYPGTALNANSVGEYNGSGSSVSINLLTNGAGNITGINLNNMVLNYSTNNASLGTFPLQYGYNNSDTVAGTFSGMGYNGTFTGTCVTTVDGYGTVSASVGNVSNVPVTRLKIVQTLSLSYLSIAVGTINQTFYLYYQSGVSYPMVRSIYFAANVPSLNYNYTLEAIEFYGTVASTNSFSKNTLTAYPNPTTNVLNFTGDTTPGNITVTDTAGRTVLTGTGTKLDVSTLNAGVYIATVTINNKAQCVKFIKQ